MSLLTNTSSKMPKTKSKRAFFRGLWNFIKSIKYDILFVVELFALVFATFYSLFGRKKEFSFFASLSTLIGSLLTLSGIKHINSKLKESKYEDIISADASKNKEKEND